MKTFWNIISFLAVVHLLALLMFLGWLWQSGRIDRQRIGMVRDLFSLTISESETNAAADEEVRAAALREQIDQAELMNPSLPSATQVSAQVAVNNEAVLVRRRLQEQSNQLLDQLQLRARALEKREEELLARQRAWEAGIADRAQQQQDEQFAQAVKQYESAPPELAKQWMLELIANGQKNQVVAYLDAMNARAASKILRTFTSDSEMRLATELLENLRTYGVDAEAVENFSNDGNAPAAP